MHVLCDTCSVIMLLRIAPEMFVDSRFECVTVNVVYQELRKQPRFKSKYPWLPGCLPKVRGLPQTQVETIDYRRTLAAARLVSETAVNSRTSRRFSLSRADLEVASAVITHGYDISTAEHDLEDFLAQEFDVINSHPLVLVNEWIERGLIVWGDAQQRVIEDWVVQNERRPPWPEIQRFEKAAKRKYPH